MNKATCTAPEGCDQIVHARGLCGKHYMRWLDHGDTALVREAPPETCTIDDCHKPHESRGWCAKHYARFLRYGDPLGKPAPKPNDAITYFSFHRRLRKARGSAKDHPCVQCGKPSVHWAQIHDEDPRDFASYVPMCRSCHAKYDIYPDTREKWRRGVETVWTPAGPRWRSASGDARKRKRKRKGRAA